MPLPVITPDRQNFPSREFVRQPAGRWWV